METLYAIALNDGTEIGNRVGVEGEAGVERSKKFEEKLNVAESRGAQILFIFLLLLMVRIQPKSKRQRMLKLGGEREHIPQTKIMKR